MKLKCALVASLLIFSYTASAEYVYCPGNVSRIQIENDKYMVWLNGESGSSIHEIGVVGDEKGEKYFSMALTSYATQDNFQIRYTLSAASQCSALRSNINDISYITMLK